MFVQRMFGGGGVLRGRDTTRKIKSRKKFIAPQKRKKKKRCYIHFQKNGNSSTTGEEQMDTGTCVIVFESVYGCSLGGAGVCGLSVYLSGGTPHRPQQFQA